MMEQPQQIVWTLAPDEAQFLLNIMSERPLREVMNLFNKCAQQTSLAQNPQQEHAPGQNPGAEITDFESKEKGKARA